MQIIFQPDASFRLGDFLRQSFEDSRWKEFRAAIAFVKYSGTKHVREALAAFSGRAKVTLSVGIDSGGTSVEGLSDLLSALEGRGDLWVFHNVSRSSFHPKIYLFKNERHADFVIGSGNLTEGGLFTNYEANVRVQLDLRSIKDIELLSHLEETLDYWSSKKEGLCYRLDAPLLGDLVEREYVPKEAESHENEEGRKPKSAGVETSIFRAVAVPRAPIVPKRHSKSLSKPVEEHAETERRVSLPTEVSARQNKVFLMTLQRTDMGVGQVTRGTSRRSPEVFIPLAARDANPEFWGWPALFVQDPKWRGPIDRNGIGKMDRQNVRMRIGLETVVATIWYNPDKKDVRIRSENLRSAGAAGDVLYMERTDRAGGFDYYVQVIPESTSGHAAYVAKCVNSVKNSKKRWAYI
jgi:HKD family nuclease